MALFNNFPYTDLNDINLDYTLQKLESLYTRGEQLYSTLTTWQQATDAELEQWKAATESSLALWKTQTENSIDTKIQLLTAAINTAFTELRTQLEAHIAEIETTAVNAASAASASATAAAGAASAASINNEQSKEWAIGETLEGDPVPDTNPAYENNAKYYADLLGQETEQIDQNTADITDLKSAIDKLSDGKIGYQLVNNSYITTSGVITPYNGWSRTEYLHCDEYAKLKVIVSDISDSQYNAFYDANQTFISKFTVLKNTVNTFDIPANAVYFICSNNTTAMGKYEFRLEDSRIKNELESFETEETAYRATISEYKNVSTAVSTFPGVEKMSGVSASASTTAIRLNTLATMDTYVLFLDNDVSLYFSSDTIAQADYLAICKIDNAVSGETTISGTNGARYRNLDSNLPTSASPLSLAKGSAIAITVNTGTDVSVVTNGIMRTLSDYMLLSQTQLNQIVTDYNYITFNGNQFTFDMGDYKLYINHQTNNEIRQDVWRVARGTIVSNGTEYDMWNGSDADGVVILDGESDFLGGLHGDELTTKTTCFIDGIEHPISTAFNKKEFTNFNLYVESDVYHCIDSTESSTKAFTRNKIITINENGCSITNYWKAVSSVNVKTAYMGMLSVAKSLVTDYSMNSDSAIRDNETLYPGASYCNKAKMQLSTGNVVEYSMTDGSGQSPWGYGHVYSGTGVSNRVKAYFAEIYEDTYRTLNSGDIIRACSTMKVY